MKKGVIFDLDGTLINSLPDISAAMNRALAKNGLPTYPEESYKYKVGDGVMTLAKRAVGAHAECYQAVLSAYMEDYAQNCRVHTRPYDGVHEMLRSLSSLGLKVFVLTNKDQADAEHVLAHYFPAFPFSAVRGRQAGFPLKPDPSGALLIAQTFSLSSDNFWYVGDTGTDMQCGNAAGMETVGVLWGFRPREELADNNARHIIAAPDELLRLVENG